MSQMLKSSGAMGAATLASRVLGLVRNQVYASFMGTGPVASAFIFAFTIPNLFRRLLGEGALTAAFIPIFKAKEKNEGEKEMWRATNAVISGLIVSASFISVIAILVVSALLGFFTFDVYTRLMLELLRIMFPYAILVCLAAVFMGMLNARGHFFIPALGAAMLNVVMIASVLFLAPQMGKSLETQIFALAYGVLIAGLAQAFFQFPSLRGEGFRYRWEAPWKDATVREVIRKMIPGSIGVAAFQINVLLTQSLAFGENKNIVAHFEYAVRLMELPQGVFGISLATFLLPTLSGLAAEKKYPEFRATLRQGLMHLMFVNLLASMLLLILAEPIIRLLFEHGKFGPSSTQNVGFALVCLAPGLVAFSMVNILARAFYALGDVQTPMRISVACLFINIVLAAFFLFQLHLGAGGLGIANVTSSTMNLSLLFFALRKKLKTLELAELRAQLWPLLGATGVAAVVALGLQWIWNRQFGHATLVTKFGHVFVPMLAATAVYFGMALWMKVPSAREMIELFLSKLRRKKARQG